MSTAVLTLPAPGWYPDPAGLAAYRWWDGAGWTEGTHAELVAEPVAPAAQAEPVAPQQPAPVVSQESPAYEPVVFENAVFEPAVLTPATPPAPASAPASAFAPESVAQPIAPVTTPSTPVARRAPSKTRWSTILSAYPFVYPFAVGMVVALAYAGGSSSNMNSLIIIGAITAVVLLLPSFILAEHDRKELIARGYEPAPSLAWLLLLPPIGYLIARRRVVGPSY